jgi:hypothetical protein
MKNRIESELIAVLILTNIDRVFSSFKADTWNKKPTDDLHVSATDEDAA